MGGELMAILKIQIQPKSGHKDFEDLPLTYGLLRYACLDNPLYNDIDETSEGFIEEEFQLSPQLDGTTEVWDWDDIVRVIEISIHSALGIVALSPRPISIGEPEVVDHEKYAVVKIELTDEQINSIKEKLTTPDVEATNPALIRSGQFYGVGVIKSTLRSHILVACVSDEIKKDVLKDLTQKVFDTEKVKDIEPLTKISFTAVRLGVKGVFQFIIPWSDEYTGWLWLLPGKKITVGFVVEQKPKNPRAPIAILLADESVRLDDCSESKTQECKSRSSGYISGLTSMDASEQDLLSNPDVYGEDPGSYCEPFRNPNRILSEKVFSTIMRVHQPAIGGFSSLYPTPILPIESVNDTTENINRQNKKFVARNLAIDRQTKSPKTSSGIVTRSETTTTTQLWKALLYSRRGKPEDVIRQKKLLPRLHIPPILGTTMRRIVSASTPIDWEGDISHNQATTVGLGHILEFRLRWRSNGYSLGDAVHTLTLAPRQTKRITTIQWSRTEQAKRTEFSKGRDTVRQETTSQRQYNDVVQSSLNEWSKGGSESSTTGGAGGLGFTAGPVVVGGGVTHGESESSSWERGGRDITAQEEQSLRDAIRQYADSLRQFESSVVTELSQEEVVTGISEILRNPNYCHALTVVYHQILRHLRVDTELAGVRECIFVPFSIKPFSWERAHRWKDVLSQRLLSGELRWVIKYLDDLLLNFEGSQIPEGKRCDHPIRFLSGSLFLKLAFQRPFDKEDNSYDEASWGVFNQLSQWPVFEIFGRIREQESTRRDSVFQSEIAPSLAREWVNTLMLIDDKGVPLESADLTLASSYRYNGTVRVDFTYIVPPGRRLVRSNLQNFKVKATRPLIKGSVANLISITIHYETDCNEHDISSTGKINLDAAISKTRFRRVVSSPLGGGDLILPDTGEIDPDGAIARISLDAWEKTDFQNEIRRAANKLVAHLDEHREYYHKAIWWSMDRDRIFMLLDGFLVPGDISRSLASVVERDPIAIVGNSLVFRVSAGAFLDVGAHGSPEALRRWYLHSQSPREPLRVSLPTSGLYAKALMDKCIACEEHMGSVDWVLTDKEPELETIGPVGLQTRRTEPTGITPTPFQAPIINLQNAPAAPAPTGLGSVLEAVTTSSAFRDMANLAGTQANAAAAMQSAATLASDFGNKALELQKSKQATESAPQKLQNIRRAQDDGLINPEDASRLTQDSLKEMNVSPSESRLTTEPVVQNVLDRATDVPANPIEITRGGETIRVGNQNAAALLASSAVAISAEPKNTLLLGEKWPERVELASSCSGPVGTLIVKDDKNYKALCKNDNGDIKMEDNCDIMTSNLKTAVDALATKVKAEWPGTKLRITSTWRARERDKIRSSRYHDRTSRSSEVWPFSWVSH